FFQAEDGIRDFHVTGVQTCALPIYGTAIPSPVLGRSANDRRSGQPAQRAARTARNRSGRQRRRLGRRSDRALCRRSGGTWRASQIGRASCRERVVAVGGGGGRA